MSPAEYAFKGFAPKDELDWTLDMMVGTVQEGRYGGSRPRV